MTAPDGSNRRKHDRSPFIQDVEVVGVGPLRCSDISIGGMYLDTVNEFAMGSTLTLRFKLRESDPGPIEVQARVTYIHPNVGVGLEFMDLSPEIQQQIQSLVEGT